MTGVLRGFDPFMNLVLDEAIEEASAQQKNNIGMVVSSCNRIGQISEQSTWLVECSVPCLLNGCDNRQTAKCLKSLKIKQLGVYNENFAEILGDSKICSKHNPLSRANSKANVGITLKKSKAMKNACVVV